MTSGRARPDLPSAATGLGEKRARRPAPDYLAAHTRRYLTSSVGPHSDPKLVEKLLKACERYYEDMAVLRGMVRWRMAHGSDNRQ